VVEEDVYTEYNVPSDMRLSVISLRGVETNAPSVATELRTDPPIVRNLVKGYDAALSLGLSKEYVERRGFDRLKALREIVQNALDEAEGVLGKPDVDLRQDEFGLWIVDKGRGLPVEALSMGSSDKACWMRGYYGEGLKLAAGYFTLMGNPVYAFTRDKVFKFALVPKDSENPKLHVVLGRSIQKVAGTEVL